MSWGERSCYHAGHCPIPDECSIGSCNVDCRRYRWDQVTAPDSAPAEKPVKIMNIGPGGLNTIEKLRMAGINFELTNPSPPPRPKTIRDFGQAAPRPGSNDSCHCGSGRKYKKCCKSRS